MPIVLTANAMKGVEPGGVLRVQADDRAFPADIEAWCKKMGVEIVSMKTERGHFVAELRRKS